MRGRANPECSSLEGTRAVLRAPFDKDVLAALLLGSSGQKKQGTDAGLRFSSVPRAPRHFIGPVLAGTCYVDATAQGLAHPTRECLPRF